MGCRDTIIVTANEIINPLTYLKEYFAYIRGHIRHALDFDSMRILLNSDDNGRIIGIPQSSKEGIPLFLGLIACSDGSVIAKGRGFRVHVIKTGNQ